DLEFLVKHEGHCKREKAQVLLDNYRKATRLPDVSGPVRTRMTCKVVCRSKAGSQLDYHLARAWEKGRSGKQIQCYQPTFLDGGTINGSVNGNITCGNFTGSSNKRGEEEVDDSKAKRSFKRNRQDTDERHTTPPSHSSVTESVEVIDDSESDTGSIDIDRSEEEIRKLTQDEVDIRNKLLKILTARQKKDKEAGKDFMASIYLNNIIDLSDDEIYKRVKKSLNKDQISWLEGVLQKKYWKPTPEFTEYINQFTEETCTRANIPTIVRKSCISGRFDSSYHEAHDIALHILTHFSLRLEAPMRVEYKGLDLERTYAVDTIIYILNRIFRMYQDELDVAWIEQTSPDTKNHKFDGLYKVISTTGKNQAIIIIEFSRGRKTPMSKKDGDLIKLCRNAMRTLNVQLRKVPKERARIYLVQSFIRPLPTIYMLQQFLHVKIPATFGDFEQFSKDMMCLMNWQADVLSTARIVNKATTNVIKNNIYITSVDDTPQKKESNKNQPLPNSSCPTSPSPVSTSSGRDLMRHLDSPVHEKIDLNDLDNTLFKSKN
ncbi:7829_t:CDS:2, partial [Diversispora eburnea]